MDKKANRFIKIKLPRFIEPIVSSETTILIGSSIVVGVLTGVGAVIFIRLIEYVYKFFFEGGGQILGGLGRGLIIIVPAIGGLLAGPIISHFAKEAKGHGVPEVMQAIALQGGRIRPIVAAAKIVASALCIGTGGSAGREGPIVQVGATLGSTLGQWLRLSEVRVRNLVACGAAAGIAATFNAPIAGVLFSLEIILGELQMLDLGNVIISAISASVVAFTLLGENLAFPIPKYSLVSPWEVLLYALLGLIAAPVAIGFIKMLYRFEDFFDNWAIPDWIKPGIGGLLLGVLGYLYPILLVRLGVSPEEAHLGLPVFENLPHIFGSGFGTIEQSLLGLLSITLLASLILLKPLGTSLTLGSGNSGGVFAPSLFTGAMLGGTFGMLINLVAPESTSGPGAYAVVGMAALFAGAARAPFTAFLIVFEMTNDYQLILPLMAAVIASMIVAERLHPESIYTLKLSRRGIRLKRGRDVDVMEAVTVEEVMTRLPDTVAINYPLKSLEELFIMTGHHGFPVVDEDGNLVGIVSLTDYRRTLNMDQAELESMIVADIATFDPITVYPDEPVGVALHRMAPRDLSRLPVVSRENPKILLGIVRRPDIVRAYELGVVRREEARRRSGIDTGISTAEAEFVDVQLLENSKSIGKSIAELNLPSQVVLISIRREGELLIPKGDTQLQANDIITALCEQEIIEEFKQIMLSIDTGTAEND